MREDSECSSYCENCESKTRLLQDTHTGCKDLPSPDSSVVTLIPFKFSNKHHLVKLIRTAH